MRTYEPKPLFLERMKKLLGKEMESYLEILKKRVVNSIRCNTLKISPEELLKRLKSKNWSVNQPFEENPEVMIIENDLAPGEIGRSMEHLLGYYYVQEIASMLPVLALKPEPGELVLDIASAPGSKTTQIAAAMKNTGTIIANDVNLKRLKILASNMERCGATNAIITKKEGIALCKRLKDNGFQFDKILVDAPCSGEGTLRSSPITYQMWNPNTIKVLSRIQKGLLASALEILKPGGEIVYSTCTHAPEENEEVVDFVLEKFDNVKIETIKLPVKCRPGLTEWDGDDYNKEIQKSCRIYPQDNDTEGFFIAKLKKLK
ncbi:MAG: RsmB/NOP family class I SAM-dependent RNA methyltransferase [Candidatus Pacearchaeota archaeon]|nr:RsmB/NOP family class I SAM-dependent RNA methyltransferase [Nanoarchaeota archaeon]MDZ4226829.1 RsmB/NOP family class I SAM-dependent RNA methyltransferase [Candidatus Pacearchaeota archaeon]